MKDSPRGTIRWVALRASGQLVYQVLLKYRSVKNISQRSSQGQPNNTAEKRKARLRREEPVRLSTVHLLRPVQLLGKASKANTALPAADSTEQNQHPEINEMTQFILLPSPLAIFKPRIPNTITNESINEDRLLKPKPRNSFLETNAILRIFQVNYKKEL